jgi:hypothetical protein
MDSTSFSFEVYNLHATEDQIAYLSDLHLHLYSRIPSEESRACWRSMTVSDASDTIGAYLAAIPRDDAYAGPEPGMPEYDALSDVGKLWADEYMVPGVV